MRRENMVGEHKKMNCGMHGCKRCVRVFGAFSNPNRLRIMTSLSDSPKNVTQIAALTHIEQTCVSHNLARLEKEGLISKRKLGRYRVYALEGTAKSVLEIVGAHAKTKR